MGEALVDLGYVRRELLFPSSRASSVVRSGVLSQSKGRVLRRGWYKYWGRFLFWLKYRGG